MQSESEIGTGSVEGDLAGVVEGLAAGGFEEPGEIAGDGEDTRGEAGCPTVAGA